MSFTKNQRDILGQLSKMLYGAEGKWYKLYESGRFDTMKEIDGEEEAGEYIAVPGKRRGAYTYYKIETAKRLGIIDKDFAPAKRKKSEIVKPLFEDLRNSMVTSLQSMALGYMSSNERNLYLSEQLFNGTLKYNLKFKKVEENPVDAEKGETPPEETYAQKLEKLLSESGFIDEQKEKLKSVADSTEERALEVDGIDFLIAAKTVISEPEAVKVELGEAFINGYAQLGRQNRLYNSPVRETLTRQLQEKNRRKVNELKRNPERAEKERARKHRKSTQLASASPAVTTAASGENGAETAPTVEIQQ